MPLGPTALVLPGESDPIVWKIIRNTLRSWAGDYRNTDTFRNLQWTRFDRQMRACATIAGQEAEGLPLRALEKDLDL